MSLQFVIHYSLHFVFPLAIAIVFYKQRWLGAYLVLLGTMLIDLDHLLANPVFDPCRCSIGFHPLHSMLAFSVYVIGLFFTRTRLIATGLLLHLGADALDCYLGNLHCG